MLSWRTIADYHQFNQVVTSFSAAGPDVFLLLEQIHRHILVPVLHLSIVQIILSPYLSVRTTRNNLLSSVKTSCTYTFTVLSQSHINSPVSQLSGKLYCLSVSQFITLIHNIEDIMLIGPNEKDIATMQSLLVYKQEDGK